MLQSCDSWILLVTTGWPGLGSGKCYQRIILMHLLQLWIIYFRFCLIYHLSKECALRRANTTPAGKEWIQPRPKPTTPFILERQPQPHFLEPSLNFILYEYFWKKLLFKDWALLVRVELPIVWPLHRQNLPRSLMSLSRNNSNNSNNKAVITQM